MTLDQEHEAFATARLVLPLVISRLEADPDWALAMLTAIAQQLRERTSVSATTVNQTDNAALDFSPEEALGIAHNYAAQNRLVEATVHAQIALQRPEELGGRQTNAKVLLASLYERQGHLAQAAQLIGEALLEAPDDEGVKADRDRIMSAMEHERSGRDDKN